jgi:hypothetical protein
MGGNMESCGVAGTKVQVFAFEKSGLSDGQEMQQRSQYWRRHICKLCEKRMKIS